MMTRLASRGVAALAVALLLSSCGPKPSYKAADLVPAIQAICKNEYKFDVTVRQVGQHTIAIHLHHDGLLETADDRVELAPTANDTLGNLIEAIHRVVLSSDAPIQFYLILASDPKIPNIAFTLVRYVDDVRRANANMLTPTEFYSRTIFDLHFVSTPTFTLDQVATSDINLEQFLSWQLAKRIQARLADSLKSRGVSIADMVRCNGEYQNGEFAFTFSLDPQEEGPATQEPDPELLQQVFHDSAEVIAQVLSGYRFEKYNAIRLVHPPTGRSLLLPKTRLELLK